MITNDKDVPKNEKLIEMGHGKKQWKRERECEKEEGNDEVVEPLKASTATGLIEEAFFSHFQKMCKYFRETIRTWKKCRSDLWA